MSAASWRALGLVAILGACASPGPPPPVVGPTGYVYEMGTPPTPTRRSQTAELYLRQDRTDRALELALEGIAADTANPIHYYLAGLSYTRLGRLTDASRMFDTAERIYPAYELDIEPEREAAWGSAFNRGLEIYQGGGVDEAIEVWQDAIELYDIRPEAHRNLASVLALEGRYDEAIDVYRQGLAGLDEIPASRLLDDAEREARTSAGHGIEAELATLLMLRSRFEEAEPLLRRRLARSPDDVSVRSDLASALVGLGREDEAATLYASLLSEEGLQATQLFNLGVGLFRAADFDRAAAAFSRLTELRPQSRDAWFNYVNSLFAAEAWSDLAEAGTRLSEVDPLGENARLITARAHLEIGDEEAARDALARVDAAPVHLDQLRLRRSAEATSIEGQVTGNSAEEGTVVRLTFYFYATDGAEVGARPVSLVAPAPGEVSAFEVSFEARAASYRYSVDG